MVKKIVTMGGGNAMPKAVLSGLKNFKNINLSVICAMLDSGGSTGRLRQDYKILAPGDIRRAFLALANTSPIIENLFNYRFEIGELKGHNIANLLIAALELSTDNYEQTIETLNKLLGVKHRVLPVTLDKSEVKAILENGEIISGETNIDRPKKKKRTKIKRVYLDPPAKAYDKAIQAIEEADLIIIGPGDLYSTLAQILLCDGIDQAIKKSKGTTVYVVNLMTKKGETDNFSVLDFSREIEKMINQKLDKIVYNNNFPSPKELKVFRERHPELSEPTKINKNLDSNKFIGADLIQGRKEFIHSPKKLSKILLNI